MGLDRSRPWGVAQRVTFGIGSREQDPNHPRDRGPLARSADPDLTRLKSTGQGKQAGRTLHGRAVISYVRGDPKLLSRSPSSPRCWRIRSRSSSRNRSFLESLKKRKSVHTSSSQVYAGQGHIRGSRGTGPALARGVHAAVTAHRPDVACRAWPHRCGGSVDGSWRLILRERSSRPGRSVRPVAMTHPMSSASLTMNS
jgi:hypothetical protein